MKNIINVKRLSCWVCTPVALAIAIGANAATVEELEARVLQLEKLLKQQIQSQQVNTQKIKTVNQAINTQLVKASAPGEKQGVTAYGSFRPALTYSDFGDSSSVDVTDFFSRLGFKGETSISDDLTAFYHGEWDIDIEADGDFGDARLAYAGIKGNFGRVALGKQWSPHFNIVAEATDLFNHRSSPFGYDEASPFRTNQLLTYSYSAGGFRLGSGLQFNGDPDNSAGGDNTEATAPNQIDSGSIGVGYDFGSVYVGSSYLQQQGEDDFERTFVAVGTSWNVTDDLYLALTYQDIERAEGDTAEYNQASLDIAAAYSLGGGYKVKASYFDWDADGQSRSFDGYNLTLEKQVNDGVRLFGEWLSRDIENSEARSSLSLSVGIRYDFSGVL